MNQFLAKVDPETLTSVYCSFYGGNTGNCGTVCRLIELLAEAKGYVRNGEGRETRFSYRTSAEIRIISLDNGVCGC